MGCCSNTCIQIDNTGMIGGGLSQGRGLLTTHRDQAWYDISVPCRTACPAGTDVPGYLEAVREGDFSRAYQINLKDNISALWTWRSNRY